MLRNTRYLAGLEYLPEFDDQPLVTIKAESNVEVNLILSLAKKYKIPVVEEDTLARQLIELDEGASLPTKLFGAVAAIFNHIDQVVTSNAQR
jgi:type III secretory pathway component EscU